MAGELGDKQYDLLNLYEQYWYQYGKLPTQEKLATMGVPESLVKSSLSSKAFRDALISRGVSLKGLEPLAKGEKADWRSNVLTEEQLTAANVMLDLQDNRSQKKKLQDLSITTQKWNAWLRDPAFQKYLRDRGESLLGDHSHEAHTALIDRVRSGDVNAIRYYNEMTGRFTPAAAKGNNGVDLATVLMTVLEIVQRHVKDPVMLQEISDDMIGLAAAAKVQNMHNAQPIHSGSPVGAPVGSVLRGELM